MSHQSDQEVQPPTFEPRKHDDEGAHGPLMSVVESLERSGAGTVTDTDDEAWLLPANLGNIVFFVAMFAALGVLLASAAEWINDSSLATAGTVMFYGSALFVLSVVFGNAVYRLYKITH